MPSVLALTLHGQGLDAYLSGDPDLARNYSTGAHNLANSNVRIDEMKRWIETDYAGSFMGDDLVALYRSLKRQPDPGEAAARRLLATENLMGPDRGLESASEPLIPFRPPRPEKNP